MQVKTKIRVKILGANLNNQEMIDKVSRELNEFGYQNLSTEFKTRASKINRYDDLLHLIFEYVRVC